MFFLNIITGFILYELPKFSYDNLGQFAFAKNIHPCRPILFTPILSKRYTNCKLTEIWPVCLTDKLASAIFNPSILLVYISLHKSNIDS